MTEIPDLEDARLMLGAAAVILGEDHAATLALAKAVTTRRADDIKRSRLALRALPRNQREAIAHVVEAAWDQEGDTPPPPTPADPLGTPPHGPAASAGARLGSLGSGYAPRGARCKIGTRIGTRRSIMGRYRAG